MLLAAAAFSSFRLSVYGTKKVSTKRKEGRMERKGCHRDNIKATNPIACVGLSFSLFALSSSLFRFVVVENSKKTKHNHLFRVTLYLFLTVKNESYGCEVVVVVLGRYVEFVYEKNIIVRSTWN